MRIIFIVMILYGCAADESDHYKDDPYSKWKCERDKKIAEESGSGIIINCDK